MSFSLTKFNLGFFLFFTLLSCDKPENKHLIIHPKIRTQLREYLDFRDTIPSHVGNYMIKLVNDDSLALFELLKNDLAGFNKSDSITTHRLRSQIKFDKNRFAREYDGYYFTYNNSLSETIVSIELKRKLTTNEVDLAIKHFRWGRNDKGIFDLDTIYLEKEVKLTEDDWYQVNNLVERSYFWRINDNLNVNSMNTDGWYFSILGYRTIYGNKQTHIAGFDNPNGTMIDSLSKFVLLLSKEDFSQHGYF